MQRRRRFEDLLPDAVQPVAINASEIGGQVHAGIARFHAAHPAGPDTLSAVVCVVWTLDGVGAVMSELGYDRDSGALARVTDGNSSPGDACQV